MHISHDQKRISVFSLLINVFIILLLANNVTSLKCYVCGPGQNLRNCDNFNPSNENLYAKECSPSANSCSAETKDYSIISMACEDQIIVDCQTANEVEFCYCVTDLCNGIKSFQKSTVSSIGLNDDEDLTEGSGNTGTTISTLHATLQPLNTGDCLHSTFIVIAASILLP
ncbi:hypothetical protein ILUMI_23412 [Ignelater luminosus]|uniref:Uncharacterized protein n=1 Tax=Ignelater luminosus TaxID=2038154 RepID=A0A8K0G1W7_IGNLU|nr:hypothetical protein ILUMI_23412 [Ignelater luminosus]